PTALRRRSGSTPGVSAEAPLPTAFARSIVDQERLHLGHQAAHRLLVVGGGEPRDEVPVADVVDAEVWADRGRDILRRPDRLVGPGTCATICLEEAREDALGLGARVPNDDRAHDGRPFDVPMVTSHGPAVLSEDRLLAAHHL